MNQIRDRFVTQGDVYVRVDVTADVTGPLTRRNSIGILVGIAWGAVVVGAAIGNMRVHIGQSTSAPSG